MTIKDSYACWSSKQLFTILSMPLGPRLVLTASATAINVTKSQLLNHSIKICIFIGESSNCLIHNKSTANWSNPLEMEIFLSFWDVFLIKLSICLFMCSMVLSTVISYTQFKNLYKFYSKIGYLNSMLKNWEIIWNRLWLNSILKKHAKLTESSNEGF